MSTVQPISLAPLPTPLPNGKAGWRAAADQVLRGRSPQQRKQHAEALQRAVLQLVADRGARRVGLYSPIGAETETRDLANALIVQGISLAYPRMRPDGSAMDFAEATGPAALVPRPRSRLLEPAGAVIAPQDLDIVVVPCVAVTPQLVRLGRGGGYFDRYLPQLPASTLTIAVVATGCVWPWTPVESHDQAVQFAITEAGLRGPVA